MPTQRLTIIQINDTHAYLEQHPELFWEHGQMTFRPAGGYARTATLLQQIRAEVDDRVLFCDGGDTLHGTVPAVWTEGRALVPILNALGLHAMTAHYSKEQNSGGARDRCLPERAYPQPARAPGP
jgi:2',3'-cyclic-nucleotide 2'-phosphodiesterase (5'-nucleotidase family)